MRFLLVVIAFGCVLAFAAFEFGYRVNYTPSVARGLYRAVEGEAEVGDLVAICLPPAISGFGLRRGYLGPGSCSDDAMPVLKYVLATGGDEVDLGWSSISVAGRGSYRLRTFIVDGEGRSLEPVSRGRHRMAPGELWLVSAGHLRSWDSRYFGPVPKTSVRSVFVPVTTLPGDVPGWPEMYRRQQPVSQ